jgi:ABC-type Na+ efflux pump permease subunit
MIVRYGPFVLAAIAAIAAIALNPSFTGVVYALLVIVGACIVWLLRVLYLNEIERDRHGE